MVGYVRSEQSSYFIRGGDLREKLYLDCFLKHDLTADRPINLVDSIFYV